MGGGIYTRIGLRWGVAGFAALCCLAFAAPAQATVGITATQVTSPTDPTFLNPQTDPNDGSTVTVSGTTTGAAPTDKIDIQCVYNNGSSVGHSPPAGDNVGLDGSGNFSISIPQAQIDYYACRLIAVPHLASPPYNLAAFQGPRVGTGQAEIYNVSGGPHDGAPYDYFQAVSPFSGYWDGYSVSSCFMDATYLTDPASLNYENQLFACSKVQDAPDPPSGVTGNAGLKVDGHPSFLPFTAATNLGILPAPDQRAGFEPIQGYARNYNFSNGTVTVDDSEPAMRCSTDTFPPTGASCPDFASSGLRVDQHTSVEHDGRLIAYNHNWVNSGSDPRQVDLYYQVGLSPGQPGYKFPGQSSFAARTDGDATGGAIPNPPAGPSTVRVVGDDGGAPCAFNVNDQCGSVTWSTPPNDIVFISPGTFFLHYVFTVPPCGSVPIDLGYTQTDSLAQEDSLISEIESRFASSSGTGGCASGSPAVVTPSNSFTLSLKKPKKGAKKISFTVDLPGPGALDAILTAQGTPGRAAVSKKTTLGHTKLAIAAAGKRTVTVKLNSKARKLLKKKHKVKATLTVTFTPTGGTAASHAKKLKLRGS